MKNLKRILTLCLVLLFCLNLLPFGAIAAPSDASAAEDGAIELELEDLDPATLSVPKLGELPEETPSGSHSPVFAPDEVLRVSIFLNTPSTVDAGYSTSSIGTNSAAIAYRNALKRQQASLTASIESAIGHTLDVKWNLTLLVNAISANVTYRDYLLISAMRNIKSVEIENQYTPQVDSPMTSNTSNYMTGATAAWAEGYTGAGSRIAVIDTGIDTTHQSFGGDAFDYAIAKVEEEKGAELDLLEEADYAALDLNGEGAYLSSKIPYAYNYVDGDTTVDHIHDTQGEHGSHVAGIAAANRFIKSGEEYVDAVEAVAAVGMAPDAQLLVMKVFGAAGGAYDSDYFAALEDAILLGADAANLSLGSAAPGFTYDTSYQDVLNALASSDNENMVVAISAGNSGAFTDTTYTDLFIDDVNMDTLGSPASFINSLSVASADNVGVTGAPLTFGDLDVYYNDPEAGKPMIEIPGDYDFVYIDANGEAADYEAVNGAVSLEGKIVIVNRGEITFVEKGNNAIPYNPAAVIIANNQAGTIGMILDDYTGSFPVVSISLADAQAIKSGASNSSVIDDGLTYYTGSVTVAGEISAVVTGDRSEANVSAFSSWGIPGSLLMKPEITAPGGSIYSVFGTNVTNTGATAGGSDKYEIMSGTSMAAPHIAGLSAVLAQYLRENPIANEALTESYSIRAITQSLLMSTATPMLDENEDYYSILQQGAGLAEVSEAMNAGSVIMMAAEDDTLTAATGAAADGKVKAEFGDDPDRTGLYSYSFTIYNLEDIDLSYELSTDLFTQDCYEWYGYNFMDPATTELEAEVSYTWAPLEGVAEGCVPAHGSREVSVTIQLSDAQMETLDAVYTSGAYLEGFTYVTCTTSDEEGVSYEHEHSIPVLGFYGSWSDPSMFDNSSYIDYLYDYYNETENAEIPYAYAALEDSAYETNYMTVTVGGEESVFTGNPYAVEDEFPADKLAVSAQTMINEIDYTLIRSAGTTGYAVSRIAERGGDVTSVLKSNVVSNGVVGLYYDIDNEEWVNYTPRHYKANTSVSSLGLREGNLIRVGFYAVPEYYGMLCSDDMTDGYAGMLDNDGFSSILADNLLGDGVYIGYDLEIDNTTPVIKSATLTDGELTVKAYDNANIAYIAVLSLDGEILYGEIVPEDAEADTFSFDISEALETEDGYVAVFAGDYAGNETAKAVKVNDNGTADPTEVASVAVSPETIRVYKGNQISLIADVQPITAEDRTVTWSSSDESIATVDEFGLVTGVAAGTAVITATANGDSTKTASCEVTVVSVDKTLSAVIWDEEGYEFFASFNTDTLPDWTKSDEDANWVSMSSAFQYTEDQLIMGTLDTQNEATVLYSVDGDYELTEIGENYYPAFDMAIGLEGEYFEGWVDFVYSYSWYLLGGPIYSEEYGYSGVPYAFLDCSEALGDGYIVGLAAAEHAEGSTSYYLMDDYGKLWTTTLAYDEEEDDVFFSMPELVMETDIESPYYPYESLYFDGTYLYFTSFNGTAVTVYIIDPENGEIYEAGNFAEGIWNVTGLYVDGEVYPVMPSDNPFEDVTEDDWFYDSVLWAVANGVTNGTDATHFSPDLLCTRAQVVTFLYRAAGSPKLETTDNPFTDVPENEWYTDAVLWAVANGITKGTSATTFSPDLPCTRGQVVTFLYRAEGEPELASTENPFTDLAEGAYYYDAVLWAVANGITNGRTATTFVPDDSCKRSEVVTFLYRDRQK